MKNLHPNWQTAIGLTVILAVFFLGQFLDSPADWEAEKASAAALRDALAQAQQERPDLWTPERIERVGVAAGMVARALPNTVAEVK